MNNLMVLRGNAVEDVEVVTWRNQAVRRMQEEYRKIDADQLHARKREKQKAQRKAVRIMARMFIILSSALAGMFLAMGDMLSVIVCIVTCLFAITTNACNGEWEDE